MRAPVAVIGVRCHYCSNFYPEWEVIRFGESVVRCRKCEENHHKAIEAISREKCPDECSVCRESCASIYARTGKATLYVCMKDGQYQYLCATCMLKYAGQRQDLFRGTRFGHQQKIV